jgi:ubiquinone/menaquinone biosynthesis C-methylase UbiE
MTDLNPHMKQMADESMVRTLAAQTLAIWPQESKLIARYGLSGGLRILDAGCGTGEGTARLAEMFPQARILGVDVLDTSLELARGRCAPFGERVAFENQSIFELRAEAGTFDFVLNRHVLHSVPHAERVIAELARVTRPGGRLHLIPEDYDMIHFQPGPLDVRTFWHDAPQAFGEVTGTDLYVGRNAFTHCRQLGLTDVSIDYIIVDTLRVPRETIADIFIAWRDGYAEPISQVTRYSTAEARAHFDQMIADLRDPSRYAVWMVPVVSATVPAGS